MVVAANFELTEGAAVEHKMGLEDLPCDTASSQVKEESH